MPKLLGIDVSPDVLELNSHLFTTARQSAKRAAVRAWRSEREFQAAVFKAVAWEAVTSPEFNRLFHISNENAHRNPGVKGGVPDLFLPVASGKHHGLFIELKVGSNKASQSQLDAISDLRFNGYACYIIWDSVDEVIDTIAAYLTATAP